jgi:hypothetical protein
MNPFRRISPFALGIALLVALAGVASAQPFNQFLLLQGPTSGYVEIPHSTSLNPTAAFTFEAWVRVSDANGCSSIAGKNYQTAWWIGICGTTLRSYVKGTASLFDGGVISSTQWTHIAVVFDGVNRLHYVNGENVASRAETGPLTTNTDPVRIGSDVSYPHTPLGVIDEVRIWSIARTQAQIRSGLMSPISAPTAGLEAVWSFDNNVNDAVGGHNGALHGTTLYGFNGTGPSCAVAASSTALCLNTRFLVTAKFRTGAPGSAESTAQVVAAPNPGSGLFWFFGSDNWELLLKSINGCALNNFWWFFSAATTNVFYRIDVSDYPSGVQRIYFNYQGPPAPAVTDTSAFATCP